MVVAFLVPWLLHQATNLLGLTGDPLSLTRSMCSFSPSNIVIGIWFVVDLGLMRGYQGHKQIRSRSACCRQFARRCDDERPAHAS